MTIQWGEVANKHLHEFITSHQNDYNSRQLFLKDMQPNFLDITSIRKKHDEDKEKIFNYYSDVSSKREGGETKKGWDIDVLRDEGRIFKKIGQHDNIINNDDEFNFAGSHVFSS